MDDKRRISELRKHLQKKLKAKEIASKYNAKYPISAEQKYRELVQEVMEAVKKGAADTLDAIKQMIDRSEPGMREENLSERQAKKKRRRQRINSLSSDLENLEAIFLSMEISVTAYANGVNVTDRVRQLSENIKDLNNTEWERSVKKTLGTAPPQKSYYDQIHAEAIADWAKDNVKWMSDMPNDTITELKGIAYSGYIDGKTSDEIEDELNQGLESALKRNKALVINRVSNINTEITKQKHLDAGIHEYIWWTRLDERVRKSHQRLHGRKFSWDAPPETDGGRHCHPGEDYGCRCTALPHFDLRTIEL